MDKQLKKIALVVWLAFAFLLVQSVRTAVSARRELSLNVPESIGLGEELKAMVDTLEADIARRSTHELLLSRNPLDLNAVLHMKTVRTTRERAEQRNIMRLSCTIVSDSRKTAIIKFQGKSHVVTTGDVIGGKTVEDIDKKRVVLTRNDTRTVLKNRPAPRMERMRDTRRDETEIAL